MTPARLEEVEKDLNRDTCGENDNHCAGCGQGVEVAHELLDEVKRLRARLEIIADPIGHLAAEVKARGGRLDGGMAIYISRDAGWHQRQAREALAGEEPTP